MAKRTKVTLPGNGKGEEVRTETNRVLYSAGFDAGYVNKNFASDSF